jgi:Mg-chelatase subunit ChlD
MAAQSDERLERWRMLLGGHDADGIGYPLTGRPLAMDRAMAALYDAPAERGAGLGASAPTAARWLGDIREYFPSSIVRVMQKDAIERLGMKRLLLEPEMMSAVEPDLDLVTTLMALSGVIPQRAKATARQVVQRVVQDLQRRLASPMRQAVVGALKRSTRNRRPRHTEIDWNRTIRANLKHYQPEYGVIVPETRIGFGRTRNELKTVVVCIDQSGSMGQSVVYSGVFGAVLASIPALRTHVVAFDTSVADLTEHMSDPVDVLMGVQLGGGTDINQALAYCQTLITKPADTILVLITDLYEGGNREEMLRRAAAIAGSGVRLVTLLALADTGAPSFDERNAAALAGIGIPSFACAPADFPDLMAAAIQGRDMGQWAAEHGLNASRAARDEEEA